MDELPQIGRDWENFMILMPGTAGTPGGAAGVTDPGQYASANGNLPYNAILEDGSSTTVGHSLNANVGTFETISELQVSLSNFSAQYGIGGMVMNQITKSGTSQFHGALYDYIQNSGWDAASYNFNNSQPVTYLRLNNFGGAIGGPILKKKMFFYFNYDQTVDHGASATAVNSIPTPSVMGGDFTGQLTIYDPTTQTIAYDSKGNPYPIRKSFQEEYGSNAIPSSLFDTVAVNFQQFYPTPTDHIAGGQFIQGTLGSDGQIQNNFYASLQSSSPTKKYFGRLDYDITPNNLLWFSYTESDNPAISPNAVTACPISCQGADISSALVQATDVWNISSRTINEARMGYTFAGSFFDDLTLGHGYAAKLGWKFAEADTIPGIWFTRNYPYAWIEPAQNGVYKQPSFDPSDVVTMIRGKHILHFGGEMLFWQDNSTPWDNSNAGDLAFSGQYTEQWTVDPSTGVASANTQTGLEYGDFLLGLAEGWTATVQPEFHARMKNPQMFFQDDYKLRQNLTLNLGLRYQINHGWNETQGNEASFDPTVTNPATNTLGAYWFGSTHANGRTAMQANVFSVLLPRAGFSWQAKTNTTVRGGVGLYAYNLSLDTYGNGMGGAAGGTGSAGDQTNGIIPLTQLDGPGTTYGFSSSGLNLSTTPLPYSQFTTNPDRFNGSGVVWTEYHTPVPKILQWNLGIQRAITTNLAVDLSYIASHGFNLSYPTDLNAIPLNNLSSNDVQYRPYPNYQSITGSSNNGISNYNSLQAQVTKRLTSGLSFNFNYVWSHMLDSQDSSGYGNGAGPQGYQIANNAAGNYSNSNFDIRQAFKGYTVYELPFGKGKKFLNHNALLDGVIGGWQVTGSIVLSTGNPYTLTATQNTYQLAGSAYPNRIIGVSTKPENRSAKCGTLGGSRCSNEWYNPAAFSQPADGTFGNVRRNSLYGPGYQLFNLSAAKTFALPWKGINFHLRIDSNNPFNHASFAVPGLTQLAGSSGVGTAYSYQNQQQITGVVIGGRTIQIAGRLTF
jgi:hypothetical protein